MKFLCLIAFLVFCRSSFPADQVIPLNVPRGGKPGFTRLPSNQTGIVFTNHLSDSRAATNRNLLSGSGVAAGDVDGDGLVDLYFCALDNANVLYRNLGNWKFKDITAEARVSGGDWDSTGAVFADVDGDRDLDLILNTLAHGTHLFANDGKGRFEFVADSGLSGTLGATSLALADIDGDSDLDLYVTTFRTDTIRDANVKFLIKRVGGNSVVAQVDGRSTTEKDLTNRFAVTASGEVLEFGEPDFLFENDGKGKFKALSWTSGRFLDEEGNPLKQPPFDWGLAVQFYDFTGDGAPDIYVCNDYWTPDSVWINDGKGSFRAVGASALRSTSRSSMGVDFADLDRDGDPDSIVVDMLALAHRDRQVQVNEIAMFSGTPGDYLARPQLSQNTIQLNRGDGTFAQIADYCGLEGSEWSWCPIFIDVDLDGWEDLIVSNGHRRDFQNADAVLAIQAARSAGKINLNEPRKIMELFPLLSTSKAAFRNKGNLTFSNAAVEWGFTDGDISHGFCTADLDGDGDLDLAMNNLGSSAAIYRNNASAPRIAVGLEGAQSNTAGVGAVATLTDGAFSQRQEIISGGRYLSGDAGERVFAAPQGRLLSLEIQWRNGKRRLIPNVQPNHRYVIAE